MGDCQGNPVLAEMDWLYEKLRQIDEELLDPDVSWARAKLLMEFEEKYEARLNVLKNGGK